MEYTYFYWWYTIYIQFPIYIVLQPVKHFKNLKCTISIFSPSACQCICILSKIIYTRGNVLNVLICTFVQDAKFMLKFPHYREMFFPDVSSLSFSQGTYQFNACHMIYISVNVFVSIPRLNKYITFTFIGMILSWTLSRDM